MKQQLAALAQTPNVSRQETRGSRGRQRLREEAKDSSKDEAGDEIDDKHDGVKDDDGSGDVDELRIDGNITGVETDNFEE